MIKVILLGAGNVAYHLAIAMEKSENIDCIQRYRRSSHRDEIFPLDIPVTNDLDLLKEADIYLLAINDDSIKGFTEKFPDLNGLLVHTSGSAPLTDLNPANRRAVMYPLQTFTIDRLIDFSKISLALEAESETDYILLEKFARHLSPHVFKLNSEQRKQLHMAAVFANNFTNYMYLTAQEICLENQIDFDMVKPLILETAEKIMDLDPIEAQTGPAKRQDDKILKKHLSLLTGEKKNIYQLLSKAISDQYK